MNPPYIIYLLTFLGFPFLGLILSRYLNFDKVKKCFKVSFLMFFIYDMLFLLDYSLKGDYSDYLIFSSQYFYFCLVVSLLYKSTNVYSKIFRAIGTAILVVGFLQGLVGILMFIVISQDYEADKIYQYSYNNSNYQTRRYSFEFATLDDTRYTFDSYRTYDYLPFEKLVNKTDFFQLKSELNFNDNSFRVNIKDSVNTKLLEFSSKNGCRFTTSID